MEWHQIVAFPRLIAEIKDVASPVFTSKFCHFLAPGIFPVIDNAAMGNPFKTYAEYFTAAKAEWCDTDVNVQTQLARLLTQEIGSTLFTDFPLKCKLVELCMIGKKNNG